MNPLIMKVFDFKDRIETSELEECKEILKEGKTIVFPTETVYGIGASIYSERGIERIYKAKNRPKDNPLIVHVSNYKMINEVVKRINPLQKVLIDNFWPGELSIIFDKKDSISSSISKLETVCVRMPKNKIALELIEHCGFPIAAPSANVSTRPSGTNIEDIYDELEGKVGAFIDGGQSEIGIESTVVKIEKDKVMILRPGFITKEDIENLGIDVVYHTNIDETVEMCKIESPGMKYKHYAPYSKAILIYGKKEDVMINRINKHIQVNVSRNRKVIVICTEANYDKIICDTKYCFGKTLNDISKNMFKVIREVDRLNPDLIVIEGIKREGFGISIMNRLIKAVSYNYFEVRK